MPRLCVSWANATIASIHPKFRSAGVSRIRLLFSQGETLKYDLQDRQGPQAITFDRPIKAEWVQLAIEVVFPGSRFHGRCE